MVWWTDRQAQFIVLFKVLIDAFVNPDREWRIFFFKSGGNFVTFWRNLVSLEFIVPLIRENFLFIDKETV